MNVKSFTLSSLAAALCMVLVAGLWHEVIMPGLYATKGHAAHEGRGIIFLAFIILAGFMSYLYPRLYVQGGTVIDGLKFGMLMGLLWVFPHELAMVGAHGESIGYVFKNAAWHMVEQGVGGMVIALAYKKFQE